MAEPSPGPEIAGLEIPIATYFAIEFTKYTQYRHNVNDTSFMGRPCRSSTIDAATSMHDGHADAQKLRSHA